MEVLLELLEDIQGGIDYKTEKHLVSDKLLDSLALVELVSSIDDEFGVSVEMDDFIPENFESIEAIWDLIKKLEDQ
ncbi:MAG: acyl carrier protein [Peptostreptococcaceae bacterium]|nr:acyl carrier protein [Peptostreptococcaceae bacterium]